MHPALFHQVLNDVNPDSPPYALPDGSAAKLLILGEEVSEESMMDPNSTDWWPSAKSLKIASKLRRRIMREGFVLQVCMALCTALVSELYTTTSGAGSGQKRVRLRFKTAPIADFGICAGSVDVKNQDKLAYWMLDGEMFKGQDPDDHYWIYFITMRGEEFILDCAMFTFNMCMMVPTGPYLPPQDADLFPFAPAFFLDRLIRNNTPAPLLHKERRRVSILRNSKVHESMRSGATDNFTAADMKRLCGVMGEIAGRACTPTERDLFMIWMMQSCIRLEECLKREDWKRFPVQPNICVEQDPGEMDDLDNKKADWYKTMKKWKREHRMKKVSEVS